MAGPAEPGGEGVDVVCLDALALELVVLEQGAPGERDLGDGVAEVAALPGVGLARPRLVSARRPG